MRIREWTYLYLWLIHADIWQKPTQYCKAIILQLRINKIFLKSSLRTSLVVQWLRPCTPNAVGPNVILDQELDLDPTGHN